jgi:sugar phosphate isomerase/epimerase
VARKYSLAHLTVLGEAPPQVVHIAARCGYDFVGLRAIPLGLPGEPRYVFRGDRALFRATREALDSTGVRLLDIEVAVIDRGREVRDCLPALEDAAELGARHVLCNAWGGEPAFIQDQFDALCDLAAPLGVTVECEFVTFTRIVDLEDAMRIVAASRRPNAGVLIDTLHFSRSHVGLDELDRAPRGLFHYLQICDGAYVEAPTPEDLRRTAREERLYPGEGVAPIREIVERFPDAVLAIEITHAARIRELGYERFAQACLDRTRRYLDGPQ